jgi:hypothetical protein
MQTTHARRCLPLIIANQSLWAVYTTDRVVASYDGSYLNVEGGGGACLSHFGGGIVTWFLPWVFRTPPGWNMVMRGAPNYPKHGITALEGEWEADWMVFTATMNWLFTAPGVVVWEENEPVAALQPRHRGECERFQPVVYHEIPNLIEQRFEEWREHREAWQDDWQKDYMQGHDPHGRVHIDDHQTKVRLKDWEVR